MLQVICFFFHLVVVSSCVWVGHCNDSVLFYKAQLKSSLIGKEQKNYFKFFSVASHQFNSRDWWFSGMEFCPGLLTACCLWALSMQPPNSWKNFDHVFSWFAISTVLLLSTMTVILMNWLGVIFRTKWTLIKTPIQVVKTSVSVTINKSSLPVSD